MFAWFMCSSRCVRVSDSPLGWDVYGEHCEAMHARTVLGRRMWATCGEAASRTKIVVKLNVIGFGSFFFSVSSSLDFISYDFHSNHVLHPFEKRIISTRQCF
jgi:hypothetical protein